MQVFFLMKTADGKAFTFIDEHDTPYYIDGDIVIADILNGVYGEVSEYDPTKDFLNIVIRGNPPVDDVQAATEQPASDEP